MSNNQRCQREHSPQVAEEVLKTVPLGPEFALTQNRCPHCAYEEGFVKGAETVARMVYQAVGELRQQHDLRGVTDEPRQLRVVDNG